MGLRSAPSGVVLGHRLDGRPYNPSRLKVKMKVMNADDCAILTHSAWKLETRLCIFTEAYEIWDINTWKTKAINQPATGTKRGPPEIQISGGTLEDVKHFPHTGRESPIPESNRQRNNSAPNVLWQRIL